MVSHFCWLVRENDSTNELNYEEVGGNNREVKGNMGEGEYKYLGSAFPYLFTQKTNNHASCNKCQGCCIIEKERLSLKVIFCIKHRNTYFRGF